MSLKAWSIRGTVVRMVAFEAFDPHRNAVGLNPDRRTDNGKAKCPP